MQKPPHRYNSTFLSSQHATRQTVHKRNISGSGSVKSSLPPTRKIPGRNTYGAEMRLPAPASQKFLVVCAFLLTVFVALLIPIFAFQQVIFPGIFGSSHPGHSSVKVVVKRDPTAVKTPTVQSTSSASVTPGPMGTTILPPAGQLVMTGVSTESGFDTVDAFESDVKKSTSILLLYQAWGGDAASFPMSWATTVRHRGSIPLITWEPWVPAAYPLENNEPTYALSNIIAGNFDTYITQWANDAKTWRNPLFLRFAPEMNGNWTPWSEGLNGNTTGEFVQAWKHVHDIFTKVGATNVTWMWCPNVENNGGPPYPLSEFYPGDAYVDWTAIDGFNWGNTRKTERWLTFSEVFSLTYKDILLLTTKPMIISEVGSVEQGGDKANWITNAYSVELNKNFPDVKAIVWFNQKTQEDWRIETSQASLQAFSQAIRAPMFIANIYGSYAGG